MVVDKYVGRCLDVGSTPTGSSIPLHSFAFLGKTLLNQRFLFLPLVFFCGKGRLKNSPFFAVGKNLLNTVLKKRIQKRIQQMSYPRNRFGFSTEDMGFEPTHAVTRLPRFQHGLLSLLSNLPILTQIVYHKATYLAIKILEIRKMIEFERK